MAASQKNLVLNDELGYPIAIGAGLRGEIARFVRRTGRAAIVLTDETAPVLRGATALARALHAPLLRFPLGERRKRLATVEHVLDALYAAGADRRTLAVGVGGGVAGDLFGFACAAYMRGIAYAHVATSLVAMADAAIGGKTGVNLAHGKNLAGAFRDPVAVFCDVRALATLPPAGMREGLAEIVKAAIIEGEGAFGALEACTARPFRAWPWRQTIASAVATKTRIVARDRTETGERERLNLGHTFAHGIERASRYRVSHGAAVAIGLRAAGLLALRLGRCDRGAHERTLALLQTLGLPLRTSVAPGETRAAMTADKKRRAGTLRFVLPRAIGEVEYGVTCSARELHAVLERLCEPPSRD